MSQTFASSSDHLDSGTPVATVASTLGEFANALAGTSPVQQQ